MQTEIEAKFLNVNHDQMRERLKELGATLKNPSRLMRRNNFDYNDDRLDKINGWIRLRDEGNKVTLAYKQLNHRGIEGAQEVSVIVDSFNKTRELLLAFGLRQKSYQETKRESWSFDDVEIELDEWPWIKPFVELEGHREEELRKVAEKLGLDWSLALYGSVENAYQAEYDITEAEVDSIPKIVFGPVPDWLESRRK